MFVIHKTSREAGDCSYSGSTWDRASIRDQYKTQYESFEEALKLADILSQWNPVGFLVTRVDKAS